MPHLLGRQAAFLAAIGLLALSLAVALWGLGLAGLMPRASGCAGWSGYVPLSATLSCPAPPAGIPAGP